MSFLQLNLYRFIYNRTVCISKSISRNRYTAAVCRLYISSRSGIHGEQLHRI